MYNLKLDLFVFMKKAAKKLLLFIFKQITTILLINTIELISYIIIQVLN